MKKLKLRLSSLLSSFALAIAGSIGFMPGVAHAATSVQINYAESFSSTIAVNITYSCDGETSSMGIAAADLTQLSWGVSTQFPGQNPQPMVCNNTVHTQTFFVPVEPNAEGDSVEIVVNLLDAGGNTIGAGIDSGTFTLQ